MTSAWIGLGSNLGASLSILADAVDGIRSLDATRLRDVSPAYRTPPWGVTNQPDFFNAVVEVETEQSPRQLLENLLEIEQRLGRRRNDQHWGPRLIDLDLLIYADRQLDEPDLIVPHPHLQERAFVLVPLNDLAPDLHVPGQGPVSDLLSRLDETERGSLRVMADWNGSEWNTKHREVS